MVICYLFPFIPAFAFLFIKNEEKGKVYGDATVSLPRDNRRYWQKMLILFILLALVLD